MGYELIIDNDMDNAYELSTIKGMDDLDNLFFGDSSFSTKYPELNNFLSEGYCENISILKNNIKDFISEISDSEVLDILTNLLTNLNDAKKNVSVVM